MDRSAIHSAFFDTLITMNRKLRTLYDAQMRAQGLTLSRARLLITLAKGDGMTQTELAAAMEVEQPSLVSMLDGLEKKGLVKRRKVEGDRRAKRVFLTEAAQAEARALQDYADGLRRQLLAGIDRDGVLAATGVMEQVLGRIADIAGAPEQPAAETGARATAPPAASPDAATPPATAAGTPRREADPR